jgi:hypothetical protein
MLFSFVAGRSVSALAQLTPSMFDALAKPVLVQVSLNSSPLNSDVTWRFTFTVCEQSNTALMRHLVGLTRLEDSSTRDDSTRVDSTRVEGSMSIDQLRSNMITNLTSPASSNMLRFFSRVREAAFECLPMPTATRQALYQHAVDQLDVDGMLFFEKHLP